MTPGWSVASCVKLRPLSGSSAICWVVTTPPTVVVPSETLRALTGDRDLLGQTADLHLHVGDDVLADRDLEVLAEDGRKAREFRGHEIRARAAG